MAGPWLRLYTEIRRDRKLRRLPTEQRWLWITILTIAKESPRPGWLLLAEGVPVTIEDLADEAAIPIDQVKAGINSFTDQVMLEKINGVWHCINWDKRNFVSDNSTDRWRNWKDKQRSDDSQTFDQQNANVGQTFDQRPQKQTNRLTDYRSQTTDPETDIKQTSAQSAAAGENNKPSGRELIDELTQAYRDIEGIRPAKGDYSFVGALYNKHGYDQVLDAINSLQMAAATQELKKPLLYLKGILEPKEKGENENGGKPREPTADKQGHGTNNDEFYDKWLHKPKPGT